MLEDKCLQVGLEVLENWMRACRRAQLTPVILGWVVSDETQQGDDECLHETNAEHGHDLHLLPGRHLQLHEHRQRQAQDDQVQRDLQTATDEAEEVHVDLADGQHLALPAFPEERYGPALEDHGEQVRDAKGCDETDEAPDDLTDGAIGHDAQVKGEDGRLAQGLGDHVEGVRKEQPLEHVSQALTVSEEDQLHGDKK